MRIHIIQNDKQEGPYTMGEIQGLLDRGVISLITLAFQEGTNEWVPLKKILDNSSGSNAALPPEGSLTVLPPRKYTPALSVPVNYLPVSSAPSELGRKNVITIVIGVVILAMLFGIFVWPTIYRHDQISNNGHTFPIRVHRLTGQTEILGIRGWQIVK